MVSALTGEERVGTIRCLSDNPQTLSAAMVQAKKIAGSKYGVTDDSARLSGVLQSVETVRDLVRMVLLSVCLADVLVLGMALVFWIRSRIHEIGTLLALGIGKMQIIAQFAIETGLMLWSPPVLAGHRLPIVWLRVLTPAARFGSRAS